jgi:predicted nucleic acid-binding protein
VSRVIDASIAHAWCFEDEFSAQADAIADHIREDGALVPALWHLELGNVLLQAERRGRINMADAAARLELIARMPIVSDHESAGRAWREVMTLARSHKLPTYDAAYLELAIRRAVPLATRDTALIAAARAAGVAVVP